MAIGTRFGAGPALHAPCSITPPRGGACPAAGPTSQHPPAGRTASTPPAGPHSARATPATGCGRAPWRRSSPSSPRPWRWRSRSTTGACGRPVMAYTGTQRRRAGGGRRPAVRRDGADRPVRRPARRAARGARAVGLRHRGRRRLALRPPPRAQRLRHPAVRLHLARRPDRRRRRARPPRRAARLRPRGGRRCSPSSSRCSRTRSPARAALPREARVAPADGARARRRRARARRARATPRSPARWA